MYKLIKLITIIYLLSTIKIFGLENEKSVTFYSKYGDFKITLPHFQDSIDYINEDYRTVNRGYWQNIYEDEPISFEEFNDDDGLKVTFERFERNYDYSYARNFFTDVKKMTDSLIKEGKISVKKKLQILSKLC